MIQKENGLLESPTGTGKTLSLLCSSLAWLSSHKKLVDVDKGSGVQVVQDRSVPVAALVKMCQPTKYKVIYTSRTHKQLAQAMNEMKRTIYAENLLSVCLASRDQYCIHPDVQALTTLSEKNHYCRVKRLNPMHRCTYYKDQPVEFNENNDIIKLMTGLTMDTETESRSKVVDIEDLVTAGKTTKTCPYYAAQFAASTEIDAMSADVIFCPYNYLFNNSVTISLKDAIVIFDEGHNIEKTCEEAASANISTWTLDQCCSGLTQVANEERNDILACREKYESLQKDNLQRVLRFVAHLSAGVSSKAKSTIKQPQNRNETPVSKPPITWFSDLILASLSPVDEKKEEATPLLASIVTPDGLEGHIAALKQVGQFVTDVSYKVSPDGKKDVTKSFLTSIDALIEFIRLALPVPPSDQFQFLRYMKTNYRVSLTRLVRNEDNEDEEVNYQLDLFCPNPAIAINKLKQSGVRSIIITSGTLAPMDSFECELGVQFPHKLCNPHVISKDQLMIFPVSKHGDCVLDGSYRASYGNNNYFRQLGLALSSYVKTIPKGVLVFFKSYANLRIAVDTWRKSSTYYDIQSQKQVFEEPRDLRSFNIVLEAYRQHIDEGNGAIFLAVFRGKISEGLDLADDHCRAVIIIGVPFPAWTDPHVELKREYLEALRDARLSKDRWYNNQMLRAVNQAIGRVVRHRDDFGVVILIDCSYSNHLKGLSVWLQEFIRKPDEFRSQTLISFFRSNSTRHKTFSVFSQKAVKRPQLPAPVTSNNGAKRMKELFPMKTVPVKVNPTVNPLTRFLAESGNELKHILQKEKVAQLLTTLKDLKDNQNVDKFTAGVQRTFFGLPRIKTAKHIRGET